MSAAANQNAAIEITFRFRDIWPRAPDLPCHRKLLYPTLCHRPTEPPTSIRCCAHTSVTMGIWESITEIVDAVAPWSVVEAEAPAEETQVSKIDIVVLSMPTSRSEYPDHPSC